MNNTVFKIFSLSNFFPCWIPHSLLSFLFPCLIIFFFFLSSFLVYFRILISLLPHSYFLVWYFSLIYYFLAIPSIPTSFKSIQLNSNHVISHYSTSFNFFLSLFICIYFPFPFSFFSFFHFFIFLIF